MLNDAICEHLSTLSDNRENIAGYRRRGHDRAGVSALDAHASRSMWRQLR